MQQFFVLLIINIYNKLQYHAYISILKYFNSRD